jgi:hypothetical protein
MKKLLSILKTMFATFISVLIISACSASTGSRYEKNEKVNSEESTTEKYEDLKAPPLKEDFDITPYKTEIIVPDKKVSGVIENQNVWFDYGSPEVETKTKTVIGTGDGYRVLVLTTDNIEEANQIKADVYFSQNSNEVYIDFEPPFYKVKIGDFDIQKTADDLRFKLNQLGYKEAKVIKDKINIYK